MELTHFDEQGRAKMVDVSDKSETTRTATAKATVMMQAQTLERIRLGQITKGDVLAVAQVAGIMAAKKTSELIPMCHPLAITGATVNFELISPGTIEIEGVVKVTGKTGVEMEALTAVSVAALTVYDMCKAIDKDMVISNIRLIEKMGGKSGHYKRDE